MHNRAVVICCIQIIGVFPPEIVLSPGLYVVIVDSNILIPVATRLLVQETCGMHQLVENYNGPGTTVTDRNILTATLQANIAVATASPDYGDVIALCCSPLDLDTGLLSVDTKSLGNYLPFCVGKGRRDCIRDNSIWPIARVLENVARSRNPDVAGVDYTVEIVDCLHEAGGRSYFFLADGLGKPVFLASLTKGSSAKEEQAHLIDNNPHVLALRLFGARVFC